MADTETKDAPEAEEASTEKKRINLEIKIDSPSACQRHVTIKIPHEDVERYFDDAFGELMPGATVPGFRAGRAPRKLVEHRFKKEVKDQVKSNLLMDSMAQVSEEQKLAAISEPDIDLSAVEGLERRTPDARFYGERRRCPVATAARSTGSPETVRRRCESRRLHFREYH